MNLGGRFTTLLVCALTLACGDDGTARPDVAVAPPIDAPVATPDASPADAAPPGQDAATSVSVRGNVADLQGMAITGPFTVEIVDHPEIPAVETDPHAYTIDGVPLNTDITLRFTHPDYVPAVTRIHHLGATGVYVIGGLLLVRRDTSQGLAALAGVTLDPTKGFVGLNVADNTMGNTGAGATGSLTPSTGTDAIYFDAAGLPAPSATQTSSNGYMVFLNHDPADLVTLTINFPSAPNCVGFGDDMSSPVTFRIFPDTYTNLGQQNCTP